MTAVTTRLHSIDLEADLADRLADLEAINAELDAIDARIASYEKRLEVTADQLSDYEDVIEQALGQMVESDEPDLESLHRLHARRERLGREVDIYRDVLKRLGEKREPLQRQKVSVAPAIDALQRRVDEAGLDNDVRELVREGHRSDRIIQILRADKPTISGSRIDRAIARVKGLSV